MTLAFKNGQAAASAERLIADSNPSPVYGVKQIARTRRDEACSISAEDAVRILKSRAEWGLPTRAVAWFHDASGRLYALCAEWDISHLGTTRRMELKCRANGQWRTTTCWQDHDNEGTRA